MKFCFPFRTAAGAEYSSADELFDLQKSEGSGRYLIGKNSFWHGGIHFTDKSIPHCKDREMIRCMADGEIVAYRLNSAYVQSLWQAQNLQYSTSFCLVRHRYESPAAPASNNDAPARNALTFFTLYMHLALFATYAGNREPYRIKINANDLRVRDHASLDSTVLGTLNKNAELEVIALCEVKSGNSIYAFADAMLRKGSAKGAGDVTLAPGARFWLAISKVTNSAQGYSKEMFAEFMVSKDARRPQWWPANNRVLVHSRVNARDKIGRDGSRLGLIAVGSELEYDAASVQTLTLDGRSRRFAECRLISGGYSDRTAPPPARFWVCIDADFVAAQAGDPVGLDKVVTCNIPVKAGDPLGYMGLYETAKAGGGKKSKHQVHIELFTGDPKLQAFLENRAGVSQGEKFLKLGAGTILFACDGRTPPSFSEAGTKLDSSFVAPFSSDKTLKDENDVEWLQVDITQSGQCKNGFVRVDAGDIINHHDWLKMGFQTVQAKSASDSYLNKTVASAFYQDLYNAVTGEPAPADREKVRTTLTAGENQEKWSKLIVKHPSEWKARSIDAQWSVLDLILRNKPDRRDHEKDRIDKSVWWDEVAGAVTELPKDGMVWHFHPIRMVSSVGISKAGWKLGSTSERFETGGRGAATISIGRGDFGGVSYGSYQLSSNLGVVQKFIEQSRYKQAFSGLEVNSEKFKEKWKELAERESEEFKKSQHEFIKTTHYEVQLKILARNGIEFNHRRACIHDMVWSTSVQFGPETKLILKAVSGRKFSLLSDEEIVKLVQKYKHDKTETYFASSPTLWPGLKRRALQEMSALLNLAASFEEIE